MKIYHATDEQFTKIQILNIIKRLSRGEQRVYVNLFYEPEVRFVLGHPSVKKEDGFFVVNGHVYRTGNDESYQNTYLWRDEIIERLLAVRCKNGG